jgi:putative tryptophan/tyrosine transport system substrate-binding protein
MKRREFIILLGGAAAAPLAARAEPKVPTIGFLGANTASVQAAWTDAFVKRLGELGWTEGRNVAIDYRWAEGRTERFAKLAAEFAKARVNVIVTSGTPGALAAKRATTTIPIVFALSGDPVGGGLVANMARPGGNVTGFTNQPPDLAARRLELLREVVPSLRRVAVMANAANPATVQEMEEVKAAGRALGLEVDAAAIRQSEDIGPAFEPLKGRDQALYVCTDPLVFINRVRVNDLARAARLPTMYGFRTYVEAGGLMSYGANIEDLFRRAADYVDKILRGTKAGELPVEPPGKFDLVVNAATAKALGLELPPGLTARAEVIE